MAITASSQKVIVEKSYDLPIDQTYDNDLHPYQEEQTIDCPDCFDTMIQIYDSDKMRYQCENCDLVISPRWLEVNNDSDCYLLAGSEIVNEQ